MFQYLQFKNLNNIEIIEPTKNTIILCNNKDIVFRIAREFECLIDELVTGHNHDNIDYDLVNNKAETVDVQVELFSKSLVMFNIDNGEQKLIVTTEISNIQLVQNVKDLWFVNKDNDIWECYALTDFKKEIVERYKGDNIKLIRAINQGQFGYYEKYGL